MSKYIMNDRMSIYQNIEDELKRILNTKRKQPHIKTNVFLKTKCNKKQPNMKHVYLEFTNKSNNTRYICEHSPTWKDENSKPPLFNTDDICVELPGINISIDDLKAYEKEYKSLYIIGINDCRHHVCKMLKYCYPS